MMKREGPSDDGCFKCVKITLIVLHVVALLIFTIIIIAFFAVLSTASDQTDTKEKKDQMKMVGTIAAIIMFIALILECIALYGIIKENKTIVITYLVFGIIGVFTNMYQYGIGYGLINVIVVGLTGYYAYMIVKKDRQMV